MIGLKTLSHARFRNIVVLAIFVSQLLWTSTIHWLVQDDAPPTIDEFFAGWKTDICNLPGNQKAHSSSHCNQKFCSYCNSDQNCQCHQANPDPSREITLLKNTQDQIISFHYPLTDDFKTGQSSEYLLTPLKGNPDYLIQPPEHLSA